MRKMIPVLFGLGGFLLIAGLVALLWAPGVVKKTPLDVDTTTRLSGTVEKLDVEAGGLASNPVNVTSITKSDSKISDDEVVAFANSTCAVIDEDDPADCVTGDDPRLVTASTDVFATDRVTALAVNKDKYLPADAEDHDGLVNKWPFDTEKKTYPYWEGTLGRAVDAEFTEVVKIRGLETYAFKVESKDEEIDVAEGVAGTYDDVKTIYVEPKTGAIVNQTEQQQRYLENGDKVLDLNIAFTDAQVKTSVDDAEDNLGSLNLITKTVPLVGLIGGGLCLVAAVVLLVMGRRNEEL